MKKLLFLILMLPLMAWGQPTVIQAPVPKFRSFLPSGPPNVGGCVYTFASGTSTPQATYTDSTGGTANANPVILDGNGEAQIWITSVIYRFQVWSFGSGSVGSNCGNGTQLYQIDGVRDSGLNLFGGPINLTQPIAASSSGNQSSNTFCQQANYWTGSASAIDQWCWADVLGTGVNPTTTFTLSHSGSPGAANIVLPAATTISGPLTVPSVTGNLAIAGPRPWVDVTAPPYNCDPTGAADSTGCIQNAINFACTGSQATPSGNVCTNYLTSLTTGAGGYVFFPAGTYKITAPLVTYASVALVGAGKFATKIVKSTNTAGTSPSITAGSGVGRTATSCGGSPCVDAYNNDAIIQVAYPSAGATAYPFYVVIKDMGLIGNGANGTKYGIWAPRLALTKFENLFLGGNCLNGNPSSCGSVQGSCFSTKFTWQTIFSGIQCQSWYKGFEFANDGSNLGSGASDFFQDNYVQTFGCSALWFQLGPSYSNVVGQAADNYNLAAVDMANTDVTCVPYSFSTVNGVSLNGIGSESGTGGLLLAQNSSVTINGYRTFAQTGYTSAATLASWYLDSSQVTITGAFIPAVTSAGNLLNMVIQNGAMATFINPGALPSGGNSFIGYGGGSTRLDINSSGTTLTSAIGAFALSPQGLTSGIWNFGGNKVTLLADWTCGTGGTVASCVAATIIGSGGGVPMTFTLPLVAASYKLDCDFVVGQATGATANQWNLLTATNGATNVTADYVMGTAATAMAVGAVTDQGSTTTTFQITPSWTLGGTATKMPVHIHADIEGASALGTVLSVQLVAPTVGDLVTIYRGGSCQIR